MLAQKIRAKKAISPILATLLLIVIAVAAIVVTYAWVMAYMGVQTRRAGEQLVVENIMFYDSNKVNMTIRSTGTSDSKIVEIYSGTSSANLTSAAVPNLPKVISAGSSSTFTVTQTWTTGTRYYFKVVTESGYNLPVNEQP